jgi:hypothetical protein
MAWTHNNPPSPLKRNQTRTKREKKNVLRKTGKRDIPILNEDPQDLRLPTVGEKLRTMGKGA